MRHQIGLLAVLVLTASFFQTKSFAQSTRLRTDVKAPDFNVKDVYGNNIHLGDFSGKRILLTFYRNVGCPICNLRFHELEEQRDYFKAKNVVLLAVYESTSDHMNTYLDGENYYSGMIPDPDLDLYRLYAIERSTGKMLKGMFHGAMNKIKRGKKLYRKEVQQDGSTNRIGAEFLIDTSGMILKAHYGRYVGDHLPIDEIKQVIDINNP